VGAACCCGGCCCGALFQLLAGCCGWLFPAKQATQETAAAALLAVFQGGHFILEILNLCMKAFQRSFLNQHRLGHIVRRRGLLAHKLSDHMIGLAIPCAALLFRLFQTLEKPLNKPLFFILHSKNLRSAWSCAMACVPVQVSVTRACKSYFSRSKLYEMTSKRRMMGKEEGERSLK
jgi:hypothetical protein